MKKLIFVLLFALPFAACSSTATNETPTAAYKRLFEAVKKKDTEAIKKNMSASTQQFAVTMSEMQKKTIEEMYKNAFTETTMSEQLPPMRDERIKDNFAALEVQNSKGIWEDLPFVKEEGQWKLAVGDIFSGSYQSPGMPASRANAPDPTMNIPPPDPKAPNPMANVPVVPLDKKSAAAMNSNAAAKPNPVPPVGSPADPPTITVDKPAAKPSQKKSGAAKPDAKNDSQ